VTIVDWARSAPAAKPAWEAAERYVGTFADWRGPVPVGSEDLALWLAVWLAGGVVEWRRDGLRRLAGGGRVGSADPPEEGRPALVWRTAAGRRVFSHRALWTTVEDLAVLGAVGRGLAGPPGILAVWVARYILENPSPPWLYRDPTDAFCVTDGSRRWAWSEALLGIYGEWVAGRLTTPVSTWIDPRGRVRSLRLFDGWWTGSTWEPVKVDPGGWYRWGREPLGEAVPRLDVRIGRDRRLVGPPARRPGAAEVSHGA
jgi:hypothetical protein